LEKNIAKLNKQRGDLEARLADPGSYSDPAINVAELQRDKVRLEREIAHTSTSGWWRRKPTRRRDPANVALSVLKKWCHPEVARDP